MIDPTDAFELSRHTLLGELHNNYQGRLPQGFDVDGATFQVDTISLSRIATTLAELRYGESDPHGGFWIDAENNKVSLDDAEATVLLGALVTGRLAIDHYYLATRDQIQLAANQSELDAIDVSFTGV